MLSACTVGPDFERSIPGVVPTATADAFARTGLSTTLVDRAWWHAFGDPALDRIEDLAIAGNPDLRIAATRIARGRAALRIAGAGGLPTLGAAASYNRERASDTGILALTGATQPAQDAANGADPFGTTVLPGSAGATDFDLFQAGFDATWEIDLWGKARRTREAAHADARAAALDRDAARVSLTAEVARTYLLLRGAEARLDVMRRNRETVARGLAIADHRERSGAASRYDAAAAATRLATIDAAIPGIAHEAEVARNALALLAGDEPHAFDTMLAETPATIPQMAGVIATGLPGDLIHHRPDIAAAEAVLHAATARIGIAKADFYPSISIGGSAGVQSLDLADLPGWASRQFVLGPVLYLPVFQGGRLAGRLELTQADQQAAAIRYRLTVLRAWHEVDDALGMIRADQARLAAATQAVDRSRIAVHVAGRRYRAGATGYLDMLIAERAQLDSEVELTAARMQHAMALVALYKSVGGGWSPAR